MNVSIIIPNYNGEDLLRKNLPKVIKIAESYRRGNIEIIVIDDCSTDNSVKVIKDLIQISESNHKISFKIIQNEKNLGFPPTVNKAARQASGEIFILLNTDVSPEENFLEPLIKNFEDHRVFAVGCMDKSIDLPAGKAGNGKIVFRGRGLGRWEKGFLVHKRGEIDKNNTLWVSGGSGAFRKSIWDKLSGFNELYAPFYWEDIDLSYRALKSGYKIVFESQSIVVHEHEKGAIKSKYSDFAIKVISYKNQFIFVWENATDLFLELSYFFWIPYHFIKAFLRLDFAFFLGFLRALILLPKIIQSSFRAQKLFIKSDKELIKEFL